jgi:trimethylamine--corrinoid protein Co-methyltransferase
VLKGVQILKNAAVKRNVSMTVLEKEKIEKIHEVSLQLMEITGMKIQGERVLKILHENGCQTSAEGLTSIPASLVEKALRLVPKELVLYTRDGEPHMTINSDGQVYFGTHADQLELLDPFTGSARKFLKADTELMCKIADALPNIHFILSVGMSDDIHPKIQSQVTFLETVKHFSKTINFSTNDIEALSDIIEIASEVAGGLKNLQQKPFILNYCEPIPPCTHPFESTEKLYLSALNRIPVVYMPYSMMGGTSVLSFAGTLAQCHAEVLTGLVVSQLVSEGAPFIYGAMPSVFDMKTTIGSYGAPEFHLLVAAASEMASYYGIPFYGTAGCSDAKTVDEQAVFEATFEVFSTLLSRANIVHDVGVMDHCNSVSPEMVILVNEMIETLKHYCGGVSTEPDDFALDVIREVGPGGHFLNHRHTLKNFRKIWYPNLFSREMQNLETSDVREKINRRLREIVENHEVPSLDEGLLQKLDDWYEKLVQRVKDSK